MSGSLINIGITGLRAQQAALATTGHNISNANTAGYSRQRVDLSAATPQYSGAGYIGSGVQIADIARIANGYLTNQVRLDTSAFGEVSDYLSQISQVDSLLADDTTGLQPALQAFFDSLQSAASDPSSIPDRQLVLSQAAGVVTRFNTLYDRLDSQQHGLGDQISSALDQANQLAKSIGALNLRIAGAHGATSDVQPNDLLDQREEVLRQLAQLVSVSVVQQDDGQVNVFIGKGQPLVMGGQVGQLAATSSGDITLSAGTGGTPQTITSSVSGGQLGGLLKFQDSVLGNVQNQLGRIAIAVTQAVNAIHRQGVTLDGVFGGDLFKSANDDSLANQRTTAVNIGQRTPGTMAVTITDASALTASDYEIQFDRVGDGSFSLVRLSDDKVVAQGTVAQGFPATVSADGFQVEIDSGNFQAGDRYRVEPTRGGARDIAQVLFNARDLAFASPVSATSGVGNAGTGIATAGQVFDVSAPAFAKPGTLSPPLVIRFTSSTTYDVLDNTDPAHPKELVPPLRNLPYVPGVQNELLPTATGQTRVASDGASVEKLPSAAATVSGTPSVGNGYASEAVSVTRYSAGGAPLGTKTVTIPPNSSARSVAALLAQISGVSASAYTSVDITGLHDSSGSVPLSIVIDGERFTGSDVASLDALAAAINSRGALSSAGVRASSNGDRLTLSAANGDDLALYVSGDTTDGVDLQSPNGDSLTLAGSGPGVSAQLVGGVARPSGYDFSAGGPYTFSLAVDGGAAADIAITGAYGSGAALVAGVQSAIDASSIGPGRVSVGMNAAGQITLTSLAAGANGRIAISNAPSGSAIAQALGIGDGGISGVDSNQAVTIGGSVVATLDQGLTLTSNSANVGGNVFTQTPPTARADFGYSVEMTGRPEAGDEFEVAFNSGGVSDNRNVLSLADLQSTKVFGSGGSLLDAYANTVEFVGASTNQARIDNDASQKLLNQSTSDRESLSGVNLDEEAANLVRYQQGYAASARVIQAAKDMFDVLFNLVG